MKFNMKIYGIGGFNEVGKNMTAVDLGEDVILFDCGLFLPPIVELEEAEKVYTEKRLRAIRAVPNDIILDCFNGTGTTTAVAAKLNRRFIGIDQNANYCKFAKSRIRKIIKELNDKIQIG